MVDKNVTRERGGDTVVSFEKFEASTHAQTIRRSGVEMSDLAKSPLISGSNDPDSQGYKYKRRSAADWFLRSVTGYQKYSFLSRAFSFSF